MRDKASDKGVKKHKHKEHALRMQALKFATDHGLATEELVKQVAKKYSSCKEEGRVDILDWLGEN